MPSSACRIWPSAAMMLRSSPRITSTRTARSPWAMAWAMAAAVDGSPPTARQMARRIHSPPMAIATPASMSSTP